MNSQWLPTANRKKMFKRKTKWTFDHVVKDLGYIQLKKKKIGVLNPEEVKVTAMLSCIFKNTQTFNERSFTYKIHPYHVFLKPLEN